jgi:3-deoxy-7-phosphoheptulonate synthase
MLGQINFYVLQNWARDSWKSKKIVQDVVYEDQEKLNGVLNKLDNLPPLVSEREVNKT